MIEVVWSPQAISDVESIRDYISRDSPHFGTLVARHITVFHGARLLRPDL